MKTKDNAIEATNLARLNNGAFQGHFGGCPHCGHSEGPYDVGRVHWLVCREHRLRWWIGENLFRAWRSETPAEWKATQQWLNHYQIVEPAYAEDSNRDGGADNDGR